MSFAAAYPMAAQTPKGAEDRWASERRRVLAAGLTEAEAECWILVAQAAGKFFELPKLHEMDEHEVAHAIHVIQNKLLGRPAYRQYLNSSKKEI
jgi:hypothetical protein